MSCSRATELQCVLVTHNVRDFQGWHIAFQRQGRPHGGIIGLPQTRPFSRLELRVAMMLDWLGAHPYASRLFLWGQLQQILEHGVRLPGYSENDIREALRRE